MKISHSGFSNPKMAQTSPSQRIEKIDKSKVDPQLVAAAQGMEAMFIEMMMQEMRNSIPESELSLDNEATKIYHSLLDNEMSKKAALQGGVGLSDQIIASLAPSMYNEIESIKGTGGFDESSDRQNTRVPQKSSDK